MRKATQSNWFYGLMSLMFALLLFFNANATGNSSNSSSSSQTYDETLNSIPVQLEYDKDKYYVSGYEEAVNVHLSSANRIQLNLESNADTRNFQVVADLTNVPLGTSEVPLTVKGLSSAVTAQMEPKTITVTVEKKVTKKFNVEAQLSDTIAKEGYKVNNISIEPKTVEITTGEETAKAITKVVAPISAAKQTADTIKQTVNVQALDSKDQVLSIENPAPQVSVTVDLTAPTKEVPVNVSMSGSPPSGVSHYTFSLSKYKVTVSGPQSVLDTLESIDLPVDVSGIRTNTKQSVTVPIDGDYTVNPSEVDVSLVPVYNQAQSGSRESTDVSGTSTTTSTPTPAESVAASESQVEPSSSTETSSTSTEEKSTVATADSAEN